MECIFEVVQYPHPNGASFARCKIHGASCTSPHANTTTLPAHTHPMHSPEAERNAQILEGAAALMRETSTLGLTMSIEDAIAEARKRPWAGNTYLNAPSKSPIRID